MKYEVRLYCPTEPAATRAMLTYIRSRDPSAVAACSQGFWSLFATCSQTPGPSQPRSFPAQAAKLRPGQAVAATAAAASPSPANTAARAAAAAAAGRPRGPASLLGPLAVGLHQLEVVQQPLADKLLQQHLARVYR